MQKKQAIVLTLLIFISTASVSMIFSILFTYTEPEVRDYVGIDGTSSLKGKEPDIPGIIHSSGDAESWFVTVSDDFTGEMYDQEFNMVLEGEKCNIWIGLNPDVHDGGFQDEYVPGDDPESILDDVWYFAYPWSSIGIDAKKAHAPDPDGDGYYLPPEYRDWITGADLELIIDEFDNNIHDTVVNHFGMYDDRPGPLNDYKIQILIFNKSFYLNLEF